MKIYLAVQLKILLVLITLMFSCEKGYKVENNKVYYINWNEGSGITKTELEKVDVLSFSPLEINCECDFRFGRDKNHLYIDGRLYNKIDPNTFHHIGNYIFADKDSAFFWGFYDELENTVIKGINPKEIKLLTYPWAKAKNTLIWGRDTLKVDDVNQFIALDDDWGKTQNQIIYRNKVLDSVDYNSFKIINSYIGEDNQYRYEFGEIVSK